MAEMKRMTMIQAIRSAMDNAMEPVTTMWSCSARMSVISAAFSAALEGLQEEIRQTALFRQRRSMRAALSVRCDRHGGVRTASVC